MTSSGAVGETRASAAGYMPSASPSGAAASASGKSMNCSGQSIGHSGSTPLSITSTVPSSLRTN
jgi:hypothetical protein